MEDDTTDTVKKEGTASPIVEAKSSSHNNDEKDMKNFQMSDTVETMMSTQEDEHQVDTLTLIRTLVFEQRVEENFSIKV